MEENNKKGPGIFYAVIGVATLVVAIIGATFAYFSASISSDANAITGQTNNVSGGDLTLNVNKIAFTGATANSTNLVPAYLNNSAPSELDETDVGRMITAKCVNGGYTGCHLYSIEIKSSQNVNMANLLLDLSISTNDTTDKNQWGYAVFKSSSSVAQITAGTPGTITMNADSHGAPAAIGASGVTDLDIHNASLGNTSVFYYLLVYLNDNSTSQNTTGSNYAVGSYTGSLELQAMGGQVRTSFTS